MLYKFKCKVQPKLDSTVFSYFKEAFGRRRILDKWFYFYINNPAKPVIIWKAKSRGDYQLQPGTNRYIGVALRGTGEWIDGHYVTDELNAVPDEVRILSAFDTTELDTNYPNFYQITLDNPAHRWGVGDQTLYNDDWIQPVYDWVHSNLKYRWGLEYNGVTYYVNGERRLSTLFKKTVKVIKADNYPNIQSAVKDLFDQIRSTELSYNHPSSVVR